MTRWVSPVRQRTDAAGGLPSAHPETQFRKYPLTEDDGGPRADYRAVMRKLPKFPALLALAGLAGCATHEPIVTSQGALPPGGTYGILTRDAPPHMQDLVSQQLTVLGFEQSGEPAYLVQIGAFDRPATVGALVPDPDEQQWLRRPWLGSRQVVRGVTVSLTESGSGHEIYRSTASVRSGADDVQEHLEPLIATMLKPRPRQDPPAAH